MKILFYSPYSGNWYLHTYWEATIAHALRHRGAEIRFVGCDSVLPACDIFWGNTTRTEQGCLDCQKLGRMVFDNLHLEHEWLGDRLEPADRPEVTRWLAGLSDDRLFEAEFDGRPIGQWCQSSLVAHYRQPEFPELGGEQAAIFRKYLFGGALAMRSLSRQLDEFRPDAVMMLNGSFFSHRIAFELTRERGIRVIIHERGLLPDSLCLAENHTIWAPARLEEHRDRWRDVPLDDAELQDACRILHQRRYGKELSWHAFSPPPQPVEATVARLGITPERKVVTLFTTSQSEASTADWRGAYPEMIEWVADTVRWFAEHPDYHLVIRIHPNEDHVQGRSSLVMDRYRKALAQLPANVSVVWPKDDVSSYTLMDMSSAVLAYNSTIGMESAASRGLPVGVVGRPSYHGWGFTQELESKADYPSFLARLLSMPLSNEIRRQALRAMYRIIFGLTIPFPLVSVINFSHGKLNYSTMQELAPGQETNLDRIADGLMGTSPLYPPPSETERTRSLAAEDRLLSSCPAGALIPVPGASAPQPSVFLAIFGAQTDAATSRQTLVSYLTAFAPKDPVRLVFLTTEEADTLRLAGLFQEACAAAGLSPDATPDVAIEQVPPAELLATLDALLATCDGFVSLGAETGGSPRRGLKVLATPTPEAWRESARPEPTTATVAAAAPTPAPVARAASQPVSVSRHPKVSVAAYIHNNAKYLPAAIESVLNQTYADFEFFILDDGSTDETREVVASYLSDPRVRYEYQPNKGRDRLHETFNRCMEATTGEFIVVANGDDIMHPEKIARQLRAFEEIPDLEICYHDAVLIDADGKERPGNFGRSVPNDIYERRIFGRMMFMGCLVPNPSVMFRRSILKRIGFQEDGWMHDYQFWLKAAMARCRFQHLPERLLQYRIHEESHSTSSQRIGRIMQENMRMRREMFERYTIEELYPEIAYCQDQKLARAVAHHDMGLILGAGPEPIIDLAATEFAQALEWLPDFPEAENNLGISLILAGHAPEGLQVLERLGTRSTLPAVQANLEQARSGATKRGAYQFLPSRPEQQELFQVGWDAAPDPRPEISAATLLAAVEATTPQEALIEALTSYLAAFSIEDGERLVLLTDAPERIEDIAAAYESAIVQADVPAEAAPDVEVQPVHRGGELRSVFMGQLLTVHTALILSADQADLARIAREGGRHVLSAPTPEALRAAQAQPVQTPAPAAVAVVQPAERSTPARQQLVLPVLEVEPEALQKAFAAYLEAVPAEAPTTLHVVLAPGVAVEAVVACVEAACGELGLNPEGPFADIELEPQALPLQESFDPARFDALLVTSYADADWLVRAAEAQGLPLLHAPTRDQIKRHTDRWDPSAIDIVLLTHNRLEYLAKTVDALYERTKHPFRLTIVDNASDPEVVAYFETHRDRFHRVILNPDNRWTGAFTQGIDVSRSDPFIVSDPDILVPHRDGCWLTEMLDLMARHPEVGMLALNLDPSNKPAALPDVYVSDKAPHGPEITLSNVGTVMQTIRRRYFQVPYTTDWQVVEAIRAAGGLVGFANHLVGYHLGWDEERDYPEHLVKKHRYFHDNYGSNLYRLYTSDPSLLGAMRGKQTEGTQVGLTSIVMLTWNQLPYTQRCIESLYQFTPEPFELIIVDNGSTDGTVDYLNALAAKHPNVKLVCNDSNRGFAGGCNQGIAVSQGDYVLLLNNDTVVAPHWLKGMIEAINLEGVGAVGPRTNSIIGPQLVKEVDYDPVTLEGFGAFAEQWRKDHMDECRIVNRVIGFCMLIRREVIDRLGGLDLSFGRGNFEDDDYCLRMSLLGYRLAIAEEVFIHHFGSVTFRGQQIDYGSAIEENWQVFRRKWLLSESENRGYLFSEALALPFDPVLHTEPVFSPTVEPAELVERRGFNIVLADEDLERLGATVLAYVQAFAETDDVALHVLAGREAEAVQDLLLKVLAENGLDPEHIATLSLTDAPAVPLDLPAYLQAADLVTGSPWILQGAQDMGRAILAEPTAEAFRGLGLRQTVGGVS